MPINGWPDPIEPLNHEPRRTAATRGVAVFQGRQRTVFVADERKRPDRLICLRQRARKESRSPRAYQPVLAVAIQRLSVLVLH